MALSLEVIVKAAGTVLLTLSFAVTVMMFGKLAFVRSPFLTVNCLILATYHLYKLWIWFAPEIRSMFLYYTLKSAELLVHFRNEFLIIDDHRNARRQRNRVLLRSTIFFVMAQYCLVPKHNFCWLHSLLMYKFTIDISIYLKKQARLALAERNVDANDNTEARNNQLPSRVQSVLQVTKFTFICYVIYHQVFHLDPWYFRVTLSYVILCMQLLEKPLSYALEHFQLDIFEGLEVYYVRFLLGCVSILMSVTLMIWCLLLDQQMLMLAAVYTNFYTCAKDLFRSSVPYHDWMVLSQFAMATREELEKLDDVCAVCLCPMSRARKTPCKHFFHGRCLLRCLKERLVCPICTTNLAI